MKEIKYIRKDILIDFFQRRYKWRYLTAFSFVCDYYMTANELYLMLLDRKKGRIISSE